MTLEIRREEHGVRLQGKVAVVTGGAQGMGRAIALRYAVAGAQVVVADRNEEGAQAVAREINAVGGQAVGARIDVTDQAQAQHMIDLTVERFGGVDVLVNNAGVIKILPFLETTAADWDFMFDVNCKGLLWCSQAA